MLCICTLIRVHRRISNGRNSKYPHRFQRNRNSTVAAISRTVRPLPQPSSYRHYQSDPAIRCSSFERNSTSQCTTFSTADGWRVTVAVARPGSAASTSPSLVPGGIGARDSARRRRQVWSPRYRRTYRTDRRIPIRARRPPTDPAF